MHQDKQRFDIYEKVTSLIIGQLENGVIPWRKPWNEAGLPMNLLTRRVYTGINYLLLNTLPYEQQYYLTFNQLRSIGGSVSADKKGHFVVLLKTTNAVDKGNEERIIKKTVLRYFYVFNIAQCKDIPTHLVPDTVGHAENIPLSDCECILDDMPDCPEIRHGEAKAYYVPSEDYINMPPLELFSCSEEYYNVLFHELVHSSGHAKRLARPGVVESNDTDSAPYSLEELIAEIGACYINAYCGIANTTLPNSVAYIQSWLEVLRNDKKFVVQAASQAQKAVDYILDFTRTASELEMTPAEDMES